MNVGLFVLGLFTLSMGLFGVLGGNDQKGVFETYYSGWVIIIVSVFVFLFALGIIKPFL